MWVPSFCHIVNCLKTYKERPFVHLFFCKKNTNLGYWMNTNSEILMEQSFYNVNFCRNHIPTWHFEISWQPGKKMNLLMIAHLWHFLFRHVRIIFRTCRKIFSKCCRSVSYHVCISYLLLVLLVRLLLLLYQIEREIFFRSHKKS